MSRHRNVRNLDEDDYYDDYYDDEDYDEDEYYMEQQREKERKQKEAAAKKAKQNQLKQQQIKKQQQQQQQQQQQIKANASANKQSGPTGGGGGGDISAASGTVKGAKKGGGISLAAGNKNKPPPSGLTVERTAKKASDDDDAGDKNEAGARRTGPIPQIPPKVLAALRSLANNGRNGKNKNAGGDGDGVVRSHLSLVILGHVDAGKSTLTGRLLLALRHVSARLLQKYKKASSAIGKSSFALAWFADEDDSERERGVTIDVATKHVRTERFDITVLDAPGHKDFVPNAISGAAGADCGLLVVAATTGEFEAGFAAGGGGGCVTVGQTREHVVLSRGLGVTQFVVAVNKLDAADPAWSQERFEHIRSTVLDFLKEQGFKESRISFVPVSGLTGVNVSRDDRTTAQEDEAGWKALRKWYRGPTLVEALDGFVPAKREFEKPLRAIITDVSSEGKNVTVRGRVVQGFVRAGDGVAVLPVGDEAVVVRVERGRAAREGATPYSFASPNDDGGGGGGGSRKKDVDDIPELRDCALAGDVAEMTLSGIDPARLSPGCVLCHPHPSLRARARRRFEARVLVMERLAVPVIRGSQVLLHMHSVDVPAVLSRLVSSERRGGRPRPNPRVLTGGVTATVEIALSERLVIEESNECKALGRFVLRRGGDTIAVGLIDKVLD